MDDIVNNKKKSLSEVLPKSRKTPIGRETAEEVPSVRTLKREALRYERSTNKGVKYFFWLAGGISLLMLFYFVSTRYSTVLIQISPRLETVDAAGAYSATLEPTTETLGYSVISKIEATEKKELKASGTENVEKKAAGKVILYNNYSSAPQQLVVNTRLESKDGKIFRLTQAVTIPGQTTKDNEKVPGSIEAEVVADQAGPSYNLPLSDFTIPGFKGSPQYDKFYARSKAEFTGGFSGPMPKITEEDKAAVVAEMKKAIEEKLVKDAREQIPEDYILFSGASRIDFSESVETAGSGDGAKATLIVKGSLSAVIFNTNKLAKYFAQKSISGYNGENVRILNEKDLRLTLSDGTVPDSSGDGAKLNFSLEGKANIIWELNEPDLKAKLAGRGKDDYQEVFQSEPHIRQAEVFFRPPWIMSFPPNTEKMSIELVTAKANQASQSNKQ